ncbi:MAG: hypothetical protein ABFS38_03625 [Bacteroidota bacterium]
MKRVLFVGVLLGMTMIVCGQKSRVFSVFQFIESEKYEEAKEAVELAVWNDKTSNWHRTYYAKGLLCQKAFEAGFDKGETKKTNLYPDQLVVAYEAYEKALQLDSRNRIESAIAMQYYALANDFQKLGEKYYLKKDYSKAVEAFEHALLLSKSPIISVVTDTNLVYNTAMAAYEAGQWDIAISYLMGLNDDAYSPNTALLLYSAHVNNGDSILAEQVLFEGEERYKSEESIVLRLVDLLVGTGREEQAVAILDTASSRRPENYHFPWTRGLVYQQMKLYDQAIESLSQANTLAPGEVGIYYNMGICYYNIGVKINESARKIKNNLEYQAARREATEQFREAVKWLEKAFELDPADQQTIAKLYQLYYRLQMTDKQKRMELLIQ